MVRTFLTRFWMQVDSGNVDLYVWGFYTTLLAWGLIATFVVAPIGVIENVMGHFIYDCWAWMNIVGTLCVMVGMALFGGSGLYIGLWMRLGGNACMALVLFAFEYSAVVGTPLDHMDSLMIFILLAMAPYVLACVVLALQAGRNLWKIERLHREESQ